MNFDVFPYHAEQTFGKASILCLSSIKFTSRFMDFWIFRSKTLYKYAITKFLKARAAFLRRCSMSPCKPGSLSNNLKHSDDWQ